MISTQTEQENIARVRRGYEAFAAGDIQTLRELFSPNVQWHQTPAGALVPGEINGRDALMSFLQMYVKETQGTFKVVPSTFAATGDKVFVEEHMSGTRRGQQFESDGVLRFTLSGGKVDAVVVYTSDYPSIFNAWK